MPVSLVRNYGLELPIYRDPKEVAWTKSQIAVAATRAAKEAGGSFVRRTVLTVPANLSLQEALEATDAALEYAGAFVGAEVIPHQWGLFRGQVPADIKRKRFYDPTLPDSMKLGGYALVAEVTAVDAKLKMDGWLRSQMLQNTTRYNYGEHPEKAPYLLEELSIKQLVQADGGSGDGANQKPILVDIDARLTRNSSNLARCAIQQSAA